MDTARKSFKPKALVSELTILDHFAAKAMQGEISAMVATDDSAPGVNVDLSDEQLDILSRHWYRIAASMLRTRNA